MEKPTILVVEDEGLIAKDIQSRLTDLGHHVPLTVISGEETIRQAKKIGAPTLY